MVIGIIDPVGGHGAMAYYNYGLGMGLTKNGVKVRYYTCDETIKNNIFENIQTFVFFPNIWKSNFLVKIIKYIYGHLRAYKDLKKNNVPLIHLHFFSFRGIDFLMLLIAKWKKFKIVATVHDINSFHKKSNSFLEKRSYELMDHVVVQNKFSYDLLIQKTFIDKNHVSIIPHGNYLPFIFPLPAVSSQCFTVLFFGLVKQVKGIDILLKAVAQVKKKGYKLKLIIAGMAWKSDLDGYLQLINELGIGMDVVTDFRFIPDEEVPALYAQADLVVLPYKEIYQSGSLLFAMSYRKPTLCSDLPAFKDMIIPNYNGFLFKTEDAEALAEKIIYVISNPSIIPEILNKADKLITQEHDWVNIGKLTKEVYQKLQ
jgi:D-inositol-3-phosphate glycosyltransferase